jgi:hypothetical protein
MIVRPIIAGVILVIAVFEFQGIVATVDKAFAQWIVPSELNEAYKTSQQSSTFSVKTAEDSNRTSTTNMTTESTESTAGR